MDEFQIGVLVVIVLLLIGAIIGGLTDRDG